MSTSRRATRKPLLKSRNRNAVIPALSMPLPQVGGSQKIPRPEFDEQKIYKSEALLAQAEQLANLGSWEWDLENGAIIWSDNMYRLRGFTPREVALTEEFCSGLLTPSDRERGKELLAQAIASGKSGEHEFRAAIKDGTLRVFQTRFSPVISDSGKVLRIMGTTQDITDRNLAEEKIQKSEALLRRLTRELMHAQDIERRQIARDLHDSTGQDLVALATNLGQLRGTIPSNSRKVRKLVAQAQALTERMIAEVRTLSYLLHPPMLEEGGLEDAICHCVQGFSSRSGISVKLEISRGFGRIGADLELALFRVVQESLANIQRHSGSSEATIRIQRSPAKVTLEVSDKGSGISRRQENRGTPLIGVGIPSMQERMKQIGGVLEIESGDQGTTIRATVSTA
jgi:PAS domain S-box-containing protein